MASPGRDRCLAARRLPWLPGCPVLQLPFKMGCKDLVVIREWGCEVVAGFLYCKLAKHFGFITLLLAVIDILINIFIA